MMTAPNFAALERQSAVWHTLSQHPELPAFTSWAFDVAQDKVYLYVATTDAADAYADVFGVAGPEPEFRWYHFESSGRWSYLRYNDRFSINALGLSEPLPPHGVETADDSGPDREAAVAS